MRLTHPAGGYIEPKKIIPGWWIWAYWINPMSWAQQSLAINEFKCAMCLLLACKTAIARQWINCERLRHE